MKKRKWFAILALASAVVLPLSASSQTAAQPYPSKPVRIVFPYVPGSAIDLFIRQVANRLSPIWRQSVLIENRSGGGTVIGAELVARAAPDGYTIMFTSDATITLNPHLKKKLPYDPFKDFVSVTQLIQIDQVLIANLALPAGNLKELVAYAKANPGKLSYGSNGIGSDAHLGIELLKSEAGIDMVHIPYKGIGESTPATLSGQVQLSFTGISLAAGLIKSGKVRGLAIDASKRSNLLPDVMTFAEQGYGAVNAPIWFGIFAPTGTPAPIVERLYRDFKAVLDTPDFRKEVLDRGFTPFGTSPAEFASFIAVDYQHRGRMAKLSGIQPE